jgi:hypothetical protein
MSARSFFLRLALGGLACVPGLAGATAWQGPVYAFRPEDEVQLTQSQRAELETTACHGWHAERREYVVTWRVPSDKSLLAYVRCHGMRDSEGQIPVNEIRCTKEVAEMPWQCDHHNSRYRIDVGNRYVLAADPQMVIDVPGESPDKSADAVAAILASEPQRLNGKYCELPRYVEGAYEIECEGKYYAVKRTCDAKGCRHAVRIKETSTTGR